MYLIGITGPIAVGKTTVAKLYKEMGAYLIDADNIGHKLLDMPDIKKQIVDIFGDGILGEGNKIDRSKLGKIVFESQEKIELLNAITEHHITSQVREKILELEDDGFPGILAIEAALLPKWELYKAMDLIILVDAPKWQRMNRLVRQRGLTQEDAEKRIAMQEDIFKNFHPKQALVVNNNGDFPEVHTNSMRAWLIIKENARQKALKEKET